MCGVPFFVLDREYRKGKGISSRKINPAATFIISFHAILQHQVNGFDNNGHLPNHKTHIRNIKRLYHRIFHILFFLYIYCNIKFQYLLKVYFLLPFPFSFFGHSVFMGIRHRLPLESCSAFSIMPCLNQLAIVAYV